MPKKTALKPKTKKHSSAEINLQALAHAGTKDAINKIEAYMKSEEDPIKKAEAEMALDKCEHSYYSPANQKEEEEFLLCRIIWRKQNYIEGLKSKKGSLEFRLEKFELEKKVHEKVLERHKNRREDWKYNVMDYYANTEREQLAETNENIAYEEAWVAEAKKMITTARYKPCIPKRHLEHFDFDYGDCGCEDEQCGCCNEIPGDIDPDEIPF